jgi:hypothetical protein
MTTCRRNRWLHERHVTRWRVLLTCCGLVDLLSLVMWREAVAAAEPDPRTVLEACHATLSVTDDASFNVTVDLADQRPTELVHQLITAQVRRKGDLIDYSGYYRFPDKPEWSYRFRNVVNAARSIGYQVKPRDNQDLDRAPESGFTSEKRKDEVARLVQWLQHGGFLDGYCDWTGRLRVPDLLLTGHIPLTVEHELVQETPCLVVRGQTEYGDVTCWMTADEHHTLQSFRIIKREGDRLAVHVSGREMRVGRPVQTDGPDYPQSCEIRFEDVEHEIVEGAPVIVRGTLTMKIDHIDGTHTLRTYRAERADVRLSPDLTGTDAFKIDLPDGTAVTHWDHTNSGVRYEWRDGDVRLPGAYFDAAASPSYATSRTGTWLLLLNAVVVLAIGVGVWWRSRKRAA